MLSTLIEKSNYFAHYILCSTLVSFCQSLIKMIEELDVGKMYYEFVRVYIGILFLNDTSYVFVYDY